MALYYFDIHDGTSHLDAVGIECSSLDEVKSQAMRVLPEIAREQACNSNDRLAYTILVSDEDHKAVYSATLVLVGQWLIH